MHEDRSCPHEHGEELVAPATEDSAWQRQVLNLLLAEAPHQLSREEIERELLDGGADFSEQDGIERALEDLEGVGLIRRPGELYSPTRAARHMDGLLA